MGKLSLKHARFVAEYLRDLNATQAAIRAGYSEKTSRVQGPALLAHPAIMAAISEGQARRLETAELSATRVLEELRRLSFSDVRSLFDADGNLKPIHTLTAEEAACIGSFEVVKKNAEAGDGKIDVIHKLKTWDKTRSLEMLAKHFALLVERHDLSGDADLIEALMRGRKRAAER